MTFSLVNVPSPLFGLPGWLSGKEPACQCRKFGFDPWVRKIPWRRKWQPTPVFLLGEFHGQRNLVGYSPQGLQSVRHDWAKHSQKINDVCCFPPIPIGADCWEVRHNKHTSARTEATYSISVFLAYKVQKLLWHVLSCHHILLTCPWCSRERRCRINILAWNRSRSHFRCPGADIIEGNMGTEA